MFRCSTGPTPGNIPENIPGNTPGNTPPASPAVPLGMLYFVCFDGFDRLLGDRDGNFVMQEGANRG